MPIEEQLVKKIKMHGRSAHALECNSSVKKNEIPPTAALQTHLQNIMLREVSQDEERKSQGRSLRRWIAREREESKQRET